MVVIYSFQKNLRIEDLSRDAVAHPFRVLHAKTSLDYGAGRGALIMKLSDLETGRFIVYTIMDKDRFRMFIGEMGVASAKELSGRSVVGFVDGKDLEGMSANNFYA